MARLKVEIIVATSQPIPAYGGIQIGENVLEDLALNVREGRLPMHVGHDLRRPIDSRVLEANVRDRDDGYKEVWALVDVDADRWQEFEKERIAAGAPGGMSFSGSVPHGVVGPEGATANEAVIELAADMDQFSKEELQAAALELGPIGVVAAGQRVEFGAATRAVVDFSIMWNVVVPFGISAFANLATASLLHFLRPKKHPTIFHFHIEDGDRMVSGLLETNDPAVLERAIDAFEALAVSVSDRVVEWDDEAIHWRASDR